MKTMHLFAGAGGGLLSDLILGHEPVVAVEWDAYCCQVLRERAEEGWFPGLQVWEGDVRLFDPSEYKGKVDCIHAGFPCQDISVAGSQAGIDEGTRSGLYREVLRIADEVRPDDIFLENVSAIIGGDDGRMLRIVSGDIASLGYTPIWLPLSASQVGANHGRERWWCLARKTERVRISNPNSAHEGREWMSERTQKERAEHSEFCWWAREPKICRVADGIPDWSHQLKALGNGQVPLQAAVAFSILWKMMEAANE